MNFENWRKVEKELNNGIFGIVELKIDGYDISIVVERYKMKLVYAIYVNGYIKSEWIINDCEIRDRFYQKHTKHLFSKAKISKESKEMQKYLNENNKSYDSYSFYWSSFNRMKSHLIKNNTSIEFINDDVNPCAACNDTECVEASVQYLNEKLGEEQLNLF